MEGAGAPRAVRLLVLQPFFFRSTRHRLTYGSLYLVAEKGMSEEDAAKSENWPREQVTFLGQHLPDYARCVDISTLGAQKEMIFPSLLAIAMPVADGLVFGVPVSG